MENKLKTPLLQSAAIIAAVIVFVLVIGTSGSTSAGGGIVALFSAVGNTILWVIGMAIALAISIAILIGIFLAAVAMVDSAEAARMWDGLKKNSSAILLALSCASCDDNNVSTGISEEEYTAMKEELTQLEGKNAKLQAALDSLLVDNAAMQNSVSSLDADNNVLKSKVDELTETIETLKESETKINELVAQLSAKVENTNDQEFKDQISALEQLQTSTKAELETITARLAEVETKLAKPPAKRTTAAKKTTTAKKTTARKTTARTTRAKK